MLIKLFIITGLLSTFFNAFLMHHIFWSNFRVKDAFDAFSPAIKLNRK